MSVWGLTRSRLRGKLLAFFFANPERNLHLREIAAILREDPGNLSREMRRLCEEGLFISNTTGRQKFFSLNRSYPLYSEVKSIVFKTSGVYESLRRIFENEKAVRFAFIYGSFVTEDLRSSSDIDIMLVVEDTGFDDRRILKEISSLEKQIGREIDYAYFPEKEWAVKIAAKDSFLTEVLKSRKVMIKGNEKEIRRLGRKRSA